MSFVLFLLHLFRFYYHVISICTHLLLTLSSIVISFSLSGSLTHSLKTNVFLSHFCWWLEFTTVLNAVCRVPCPIAYDWLHYSYKWIYCICLFRFAWIKIVFLHNSFCVIFHQRAAGTRMLYLIPTCVQRREKKNGGYKIMCACVFVCNGHIVVIDVTEKFQSHIHCKNSFVHFFMH